MRRGSETTQLATSYAPIAELAEARKFLRDDETDPARTRSCATEDAKLYPVLGPDFRCCCSSYC